MFGLLRQNSCGLQEEAREHYRLHHCGTCKVLGNHYRQSARLFLNFDCVFLAELLSAQAEEDPSAWPDSYHSFNCFASDSNGAEVPLPLRFAAATNVLLSALKTDDHLKDAPNFFWRTLKRWFDPDFIKAEKELTRMGVDMNAIWNWIGCQQQREKTGRLEGVVALEYYAEPTARITAEIFAKGAALVGRNTERSYQFGYQLGELVYVLDALEDQEKDEKKHQFNALQRAWGKASESSRQAAADHLFALSRQLRNTIQELPLPAAVKVEFQERLSANVAVRVANALEGKKPFVQNLKRSLFARLALRVQNARSLSRQLIRPKHPWISAPQYAVSFLAVLVLPETAKHVETSSGQGIAFTAVLAAFFSALVFWPRMGRFFAIYKKEARRRKKPRGENDPNEKKKRKYNQLLVWLICLAGLVLGCIFCFKETNCLDRCDPLGCYYDSR